MTDTRHPEDLTSSELPEGAIAIVGMAGRFPGADSIEALWQMLLDGRDAMRSVPEPVLARSIHADIRDAPDYVAMMCGIEDYDCFDAAFFGLSPREAAFMDPQHRLLLETAWSVFEDAGIPTGDRDGLRTGVFTSVNLSCYLIANVMPRLKDGTVDPFEIGIANDKDYVGTRIAYLFDLKGPALTVQTACSSSLVGTHLACQSLLAHDCDRALVGACSVLLPNALGYLHTPGGIRSSDGRCRPFDTRGDGTIFASSAAMVMLRRLEDAVESGDRILAVIRGTAINNDASGRVGFAAPGVDGQASVIAEALAVAGVDPLDIGYVEAHGTATPLGDPIEVAALTQAFTTASSDPSGLTPGRCPIGSIKSNLGHLDTAAGVAGLIKAALAIERGHLPATMHTERPNPELRIDQTPFRLLASGEEWPRGPHPRRAGVSSFGVGGTNAHAVLEEAPQLPDQPVIARPSSLLLLSARDDRGAEAMVERLASHLTERPTLDIGDVGHTLRHGRTALPERRLLVAKNSGQAALALEEGRVLAGRAPETPPPLAFVLPGQGSQYPGLVRRLRDVEPVFRHEFDALADMIGAAGGPDLQELIAGADAETLARTEITQPLLFAVSVALGRTLGVWGIRPAVLLGHSIGEIGAACLGEAITPEDAAKLVVVRGQAMADTPEGAMLQVAAEEATVRGLIAEARQAEVLEVAVINAPDAVVAGGDEAAILRLAAAAEVTGIAAKKLRTSRAFHTPLMEPARDRMHGVLSKIRLRPPQTPIVSSVDGGWLDAARATDPDHWVRQVLTPVRFSDGLARLALEDASLLLELGPPSGLAAFSAAEARARGAAPPTVITMLPGARATSGPRAEPDIEPAALMEALGRLWLAGRDPDWRAVDRHFGPHRRVALPTYPFARTRYWLPTPEESAIAALEETESPTAPTAAKKTAALPSVERHQRPTMATPFTAPASETENVLAEIWSELLYVAPIGRDDDFLELGGDSIMALRMVRMAAEAGLAVSAKSVFEARTIRGLAEIARPLAHDAGTWSGPFVATPALIDWAKEWRALDVRDYGAAWWPSCHIRRFEASTPFSPDRLRRAMATLVARHPLLRLRIDSKGSGPVPVDPPPDGEDLVRIETPSESDLPARLADASADARSIDPERGICATATAIDLGKGTWRLHLAVQGQVADNTSVDILTEELGRLVVDPNDGLYPTGVPFAAWAGKARSAPDFDQLLPVDPGRLASNPTTQGAAAAGSEGKDQTIETALPAQATTKLLEQAGNAYRTTTDELIWAAVAASLVALTNSGHPLLWLATAGRNDDTLDLQGVVGPFAQSVPVPVDDRIAAEPDLAVPATKEAIRSATAELGDLDLLPTRPPRLTARGRLDDARLSYLGQTGGTALPGEGGPPLRLLESLTHRHPLAPREHALDVVAWIAEGRLRLRFIFAPGRFTRQTVEDLASACRSRLEALIAHCLDSSEGRLSPSDFRGTGLDQAGLDSLLAGIVE